MTQSLHSYDRLIAAHFSDEQARAILEAMSGDLVTREYLDVRMEALGHRMDAQEHRLEAKLHELRNQMLFGTLVIAGLVLGIAKLWI